MKKNSFLITAAIGMAMALTGCKNSHGSSGNGGSTAANDTIPPPFTVTLTEHVVDSLPFLHSYTHATYGDKIVMFGGRRKGLHSSAYVFDQSAANKMIYVVNTHQWNPDPKHWTIYSRPDSITITLASIFPNTITNPSDAGQFRANNAEFFTKGSKLYVIGGLLGCTTTSPGLATSNPTTMPYMTSIELPALINAVMGQSVIASGMIKQVRNPQLAITGGEISNYNDTVTLAFGWKYGAPTFGVYSHQISTLTYTDNANGLNVTINTPCTTCRDTAYLDSLGNNGNFRRRDGSMSPIIDPATEKPNLMYYAGVFKNGNTNFTTPVWLRNDSAIELTGFNMRGNVYTCQVLPLYSSTHRSFYATLLGGMTNTDYSFNTPLFPPVTPTIATLLTNQNSTITTADVSNFLSVPFFNGVTTIKIDQNRNLSQYMMPTQFPTTTSTTALPTRTSTTYPATYTLAAGSNPYNGAESEILWHFPSTYDMGNGVINLDSIAQYHSAGMTIGYHFGGILSVVDNANMNNTAHNQERLTVASNRIFEIKIIPNYTLAAQATK